MKIELYLKHINQEMIDIGRVPKSGLDWTVSWPKECCILDFALPRPGDMVKDPPSRGFMLRKEELGGMFWQRSSA
jgi:hypothetical protein